MLEWNGLLELPIKEIKCFGLATHNLIGHLLPRFERLGLDRFYLFIFCGGGGGGGGGGVVAFTPPLFCPPSPNKCSERPFVL